MEIVYIPLITVQRYLRKLTHPNIYIFDTAWFKSKLLLHPNMRTRATIRGQRFGNNFAQHSSFKPSVQHIMEPFKTTRRPDISTYIDMKKPVQETFDLVHGTYPNKVYLLKSNTEDYCVSMANSGDGVVVAPMDKTNPKQWVLVTADAGTVTFFNDLTNYMSINNAKTGDIVKRSDVMKNALLTFNADKTISLRGNFSNYILGYKTPTTKPASGTLPHTYAANTFADLVLVDLNSKNSYKCTWTFVEVQDLRTILDHAAEVSSLNSQIVSCNSQIDTLRQQLSNVNNQLTNAQQMYQTSVNDRDIVINRYKDQLTTYENDIRRHENTISGYETKLLGYEDTIRKNEDKLRGYEGVISGYEDTIRNHENTIRGNEDKLRGYEGVIQDYENRLKGYEGNLGGYEDKLLAYEGVIQDYENIINQYENNWFVKTFLKSEADVAGNNNIDGTGYEEVEEEDVAENQEGAGQEQDQNQEGTGAGTGENPDTPNEKEDAPEQQLPWTDRLTNWFTDKFGGSADTETPEEQEEAPETPPVEPFRGRYIVNTKPMGYRRRRW